MDKQTKITMDRAALIEVLSDAYAAQDHVEVSSSEWDALSSVLTDALIARFGAQPVQPVDREGLVALLQSQVSPAIAPLGRWEAERYADAIIAHFAAQPAAVPSSEPAAQAPAVRWYAYDPGDGFGEYDSAEAAEDAAETALEYAREKSGDGWPEWVDGIHWGHFVAHATACQTSCEPAPDGSDLDEICDYGMVAQHSEEAAATGRKGAAAPSSAPAPAASELAAVTHDMAGAFVRAYEQCRESHNGARLECCTYAGLRAALAAAPQRVREVTREKAEEVFRGYFGNGRLGESVDELWKYMRAAGLCIAVPDAEWTALVAERDGLRANLASAEKALERACNDLADKHTALAAATKRAEEAERAYRMACEAAGMASHCDGQSGVQLPTPERFADWLRGLVGRIDAQADALREWSEKDGNSPGYSAEKARTYGRIAAEQKSRANTAEARVRELEARPAVVDAGARKALESLADAVRKVAWAMKREDLRDDTRNQVMQHVDNARAALNGEG